TAPHLHLGLGIPAAVIIAVLCYRFRLSQSLSLNTCSSKVSLPKDKRRHWQKQSSSPR
ncbi:hypothetical protein ATANTOWER_029179, partial [Ataeniobius toweri]|nr:hypothetical protein [Ataeniobius toweri]